MGKASESVTKEQKRELVEAIDIWEQEVTHWNVHMALFHLRLWT